MLRPCFILLTALLLAACATSDEPQWSSSGETNVHSEKFQEAGARQVLVRKAMNRRGLLVEELIELRAAGVTEVDLTSYIQFAGTVYQLDESSVAQLAAAGFSEDMILFLRQTGLPPEPTPTRSADDWPTGVQDPRGEKPIPAYDRF